MEYLKSHRPRYDAVFFESYLHTGKAIQEYLEIPVFLPVTSLTHDYRLAELIGEPVSPSYLSGYFQIKFVLWNIVPLQDTSQISGTLWISKNEWLTHYLTILHKFWSHHQTGKLFRIHRKTYSWRWDRFWRVR